MASTETLASSPADTAFAHRDMRYSLTIMVNATERDEAETGIGWARRFWDALHPSLPDGVYVNYMSEGESEARIRAAYGNRVPVIAMTADVLAVRRDDELRDALDGFLAKPILPEALREALGRVFT